MAELVSEAVENNFRARVVTLVDQGGADAIKQAVKLMKLPLGQQIVDVEKAAYDAALDTIQWNQIESLLQSAEVSLDELKKASVVYEICSRKLGVPEGQNAQKNYNDNFQAVYDGCEADIIEWYKAKKDEITPELQGAANAYVWEAGNDGAFPTAKRTLLKNFIKTMIRTQMAMQNKAPAAAARAGGNDSNTASGSTPLSNLSRMTGFVKLMVIPDGRLNDARWSEMAKMLKTCADYTQVDYKSYPGLGDLRALVFITSSPYAALSYCIVRMITKDTTIDVIKKEILDKWNSYSVHNQSAFDALKDKPGIIDQGKLRVAEITDQLPELLDWVEVSIGDRVVPPPEDCSHWYCIAYSWLTLFQPLRDLFFTKYDEEDRGGKPAPSIQDQDKISARATQPVSMDVKVRIRSALETPLVPHSKALSTPRRTPGGRGASGSGRGGGGGRSNGRYNGGGGGGGNRYRDGDRGPEKRNRGADGVSADHGKPVDLSLFEMKDGKLYMK